MPIIAWEETAPGGRRIKLWRGAAVEDLVLLSQFWLDAAIRS
jgi:hypothetical protein